MMDYNNDLEKFSLKYDNNEKGYILDSIIESDNIIFKLVVSVFCIVHENIKKYSKIY